MSSKKLAGPPSFLICYTEFVNESGLTAQEAANLLEKHGPNTLPEEKGKSVFSLALDQLKSPLIYILIFAGLITLALKSYSDSIVIFLAVAVNTFLGFYQEKKVDNALAALKKVIPFKVKVIRGGKEEEVEVQNLVPGDLVRLSTGQKIPADGLLLKSNELSVDESILTGESLPVVKKTKVFSGTVVVGGHGLMVVAKTGLQTKVGKIAKALQTTVEEATPLQNQLSRLAKTLSILFGALCLLIFIWGVSAGGGLVEMFELAVAVAVSSIPEGLTISLTVILAVGMQKIFKRKALVRKLVSAETLGATSVICVDKTGTLTEGRVRVTRLEADNYALALKAAVLGADLSSPEGQGFWEFARGSKKNKIDPQKTRDRAKKLFSLPFSSERKYSLRVAREDKVSAAYVVGAPEVLLAHCCSEDQQKWKILIEKASRQGYRLIGVAYQPKRFDLKKIKRKKKRNIKLGDFGCLDFLGLFELDDPVRPEVKKALRDCQRAGLKVKVITGDYLQTARAVLERIGFKLQDRQILEGEELKALKGEELKKAVSQTVLFARTDPFQKLKIVEALKEQGEVVAMTGDGVNDALALKKADIGIVVAQGTQVAKETADMVLLDSNFATIVAAIAQGRAIFENIRKVAVYLLADSFTEVVLVVGSFLWKLPLPLLPVQILWVNLIGDSLPSFALAFEKGDDSLMKQPPRARGAPILDKEAKTIIFIIGIVTDFLLFGLFWFFNQRGLDINYIRSFIFAALAVDSLLYVFACKTFKKNLWQIRIFNNSCLNLAVLFGFFLLFITFALPPLSALFKVQPLGAGGVELLIVLGIIEIGLIELVKFFFIG